MEKGDSSSDRGELMTEKVVRLFSREFKLAAFTDNLWSGFSAAAGNRGQSEKAR
jgi:hypothetical protein